MVVKLPRQPGQKEERYAHLLSGEPEIPEVLPGRAHLPKDELLSRIEILESELEALQERIGRIEDQQED